MSLEIKKQNGKKRLVIFEENLLQAMYARLL